MNAMRDAWTDERLDDLTARMEKDFRRVDERFEQVDRRFDKVDQRFERVDERFDQLNARFDSLQQSIILVGGGLLTSFIVAMTGLIATRL